MKTFILFLFLMSLSLAMICQNNSQAQCQIPECIWISNTCLQSKGLCPPGTFGSNSPDSCRPCSVLTKNNCSLFCPSYYYNSNASSCATCKILDYNCISCNESACFQCYSGFQPSKLFPTQCVPTPCLILNCLLCGPNGTCSLCKSYSNHPSFLNNTIFLNFTSNSSVVFPTTCGPTCSIVNCLICYSPSYCSVCSSNYYLSNDSTTCVLSCNAANCMNCLTQSTCLVCISGYSLNLNTLQCDIQCLVSNCLACSYSTTCQVCIAGYQPNPTNNYCSFICSVQFCKQCSSDSICTQCQMGFQLGAIGTSCLPTICFIQNCLICNTSSTCSQCNNISQLGANDTLCIEICLSTIPNCQTCMSTTNCLACTVGNALSPMNTVCSAICTIPSCFVCKTSTSCLFCEANYILSTDEQSCSVNCGIPHCQNCEGLTTCQTCQTDYVLMNSGTNCFPPCSPGSYLSTTNNTSTCQLCSLSVDFCLTCAVSTNSNSTVVCGQCFDGYVLNFELCSPCYQTLPNCHSCSNLVFCDQCNKGYTTLAFGGVVACAKIVSCQVANCQICNKDNATQCLSCFIQYQMSDNGSSCRPITCPSTQYYDALVKQCVCPIGTYQSNNVCQYCSIAKCLTCNQVGCISCLSGFYPALGGCASCSINCVQCNSNSSCISCDYGYSLQNGTCAYTTLGSSVQVNDITISCPPGCSQCAYSNDILYCIFASATYHFNPVGAIQPCSSNCLTCATTDSTICTSCFGFSYLDGGQCLGCSDEFALTCPSNSNYSTSCIRGYSPFNGTCLACSPFCINCGHQGAGMCDSNGCSEGFVLLQGTNNCTMCFSGCSSCSSVDPSQCTSCSGHNYLNDINVCAPCPLQCQTCTSFLVCTSCVSDYFLWNSICYFQIGFPCSQQVQSSCTECFYGYSFANGICVQDLSCNSTSTCYSCPKDYYLNDKNCFKCSTNVFCDFCNPLDSSVCFICVDGFYLSNGNCLQCNKAQSGCIRCSSPSLCTQASAGFYLDTDASGYYTGRVNQCSPNCATCSKSYSCDTCSTNYTRFGCFCIDRLSIQGSITLAPGSDSSWFSNNNTDNVNLAKALLHSNQIALAIASCAGYSNLDNTFLTGMSSGSVIVNFIVGANSTTDASTFADDFQKRASAGIAGFTVVSLTTTSNGYTSQSSPDSSTNLGLILGLSIPLGLLFIILIIVIVLWRVKKKQRGQAPAEFSRQGTKL